jgi:hypothetical protein
MTYAYKGYIDPNNKAKVTRTGVLEDDVTPLPLSKQGQHHSPDGFSWGYIGSGPAALAHSLLMDAMGPDYANAFYQYYHHDVIAKLPAWDPVYPDKYWTIFKTDVVEWCLKWQYAHPEEFSNRLRNAEWEDWPDNPRPKEERDKLVGEFYGYDDEEEERGGGQNE